MIEKLIDGPGTIADNDAGKLSPEMLQGPPRLIYLSDVPVEANSCGSALVFRLLEEYPPDRLLVIEPGPVRSLPERRLRGVTYHQPPPLRKHRLLHTRLSRWVGSWLTFRASGSTARLRALCHRFRPEAILTVVHGYSWIAAAQLAAHLQIPLHLILHDHHAATIAVLPWLRPRQERLFAKVYRESASRLCVSPFMEEQYARDYGAAGEVLYPSRSRDCPSFLSPPRTYTKNQGPLVGAYAGNIFSATYAEMIRRLSESLQARNGTLLLFGPHSIEALNSNGLNRANILVQGNVSPRELISRLREEADFLFAPMSFDPEAERMMRLGFPSKLADYTATGLPILMWGPEYCSAVCWAKQYPGTAAVVTSRDAEGLDAALNHLQQPQQREQMGRAASSLGDQLFQYEAAARKLLRNLISSKVQARAQLA